MHSTETKTVFKCDQLSLMTYLLLAVGEVYTIYDYL